MHIDVAPYADGDHAAEVRILDGGETIDGVDLPAVEEDEAIVLVAGGRLGDDKFPFQLFVRRGAERQSKEGTVGLLFANASPDLPSVTLLDARTGEVVAETLAFGEMTGYRAFDPANGLVLEVRPQTTDTGPLRFGFDLTGYVSRALTMLVCDHVLVAFDDEGQRIDGEPLD
mgnify:CR=1 FL=1